MKGIVSVKIFNNRVQYKFDLKRNLTFLRGDSTILVIADGAAFGPEMEVVLKTGYLRKVALYLPESFEWLILKSGLTDGNEAKNILSSPSDYIESKEFFSWERFFNALLTEQTRDTYLTYTKRKLNPVYLQKKESSAILAVTPFQDMSD